MSSFNWVPIVCATLIGLFVGVALMLVLAPAPDPVRLDLSDDRPPLMREDPVPSDVMCTYHAMWLDEGDVC